MTTVTRPRGAGRLSESNADDEEGSRAVGTDATLLGPAVTDDWQSRGNCLGVDPDLFFPERGASTREAKAVCAGCVVRDQCLEFALANGEKFGIWGGMSVRERRAVRRARVRAQRSVRAVS